MLLRRAIGALEPLSSSNVKVCKGMNYMQQMLQNKVQIARKSMLTPWASRALKQALDPGHEDFAHISYRQFSALFWSSQK